MTTPIEKEFEQKTSCIPTPSDTFSFAHKQEACASRYAFTHCHILDGTKDMEVQADKTVLVDNGVITHILDGAAESDVTSQAADGYVVHDLGGKFLLPGLIDMHAHMFGTGKPSKVLGGGVAQKAVLKFAQTGLGLRYLNATATKLARTALHAGITTVRTVGDFRYADVYIRDKINAGAIFGPRMIVSGPAITVANGHGAGTFAEVAESPDEFRSLVRKRKEAGVDFIKICVTGGVMDSLIEGECGVLRMNQEQTDAVCDEARKLNLKVASHTESEEGLAVDLAAGVWSIEHGAAIDKHAAELFLKNGSVNVCTLSVALPQAKLGPELTKMPPVCQYNANVIFQRIIDGATSALEQGIPVGLGTDTSCPFVTHYDLWREIYDFVKFVGVSPSFALHTATQLNAQWLGLGDTTGTIELGKCADMIVVKENPLENLCALRSVEMVMARGTLIEHPSPDHIPEIDTILDTLL